MAALTLNEIFYEKYIQNNPRNTFLSAISYDVNGLYIISNNGDITKKVAFVSDLRDDLSKLPVQAFMNIQDPYQFLDVLDINMECEKMVNSALAENEDLSKTIQISRMDLDVWRILGQSSTTEEQDKMVIDFLETYNRLKESNDYLIPSAKSIFKQMSTIMTWGLDPANHKDNNNAQRILLEYDRFVKEGNSKDFFESYNRNGGFTNDVPLVRSNPNAPSIIDEEFKSKAGFFSFLALLYVAVHLLIALTIIAIKK